MMQFWGLDVGGANLKLAESAGMALTIPFALWKESSQLGEALTTLFEEAGGKRPVALTMTGELADCYAHKSEGVRQIVEAVQQAAHPCPVVVWQTAGEFVPPEVATEFYQLTAASNWHALATWVGRSHPQGESLLIDCGSTTTDIIPLTDGFPMPDGLTDQERLLSGELIYLGSRRTPLCALSVVDGLPYPPAAEWFATIEDCLLVTGQIPEQPDMNETPDGRPLTTACSLQRIARQFCCDADELGTQEIVRLANCFLEGVVSQLQRGIERVAQQMPALPTQLMTSGSGEFLVTRAIAKSSLLSGLQTLSLSSMLSPQAASAACAMACAILAEERVVLVKS